MIQLTPNRTVFEYDDGIGVDNLIVYHQGYIRISEIDLYQEYSNENLEVNTAIINNLCNQLYQTIHDRHYEWIIHGDYDLPNQSPIMSKIIGRLRCIADDYNEYNNFVNLHLRFDWDGDEYQSNLANYIINKFISTIGLNQTEILFAKYFGNIIRYLFNQ